MNQLKKWILNTLFLATSSLYGADMCYDPPVSSGGLLCFGIIDIGGCKSTTPIRNISSSTLTDVTVIKAYWGIDLGLLSGIGIDGAGKTPNKDGDNAELSSTLNQYTHFNGFVDFNIFNKGAVYRTGDYTPATGSSTSDEHTIYTQTLLNFSLSGLKYISQYTKDGVSYNTRMYPCNTKLVTLSPSKSITEGNSGSTNADFRVTLSNKPTYDKVIVFYTITPGTATQGTDYSAPSYSGQLTFAKDTNTLTQTIPLSIIGDENLENDENLTVTLTSIIQHSSENFEIDESFKVGKVTIVDDDNSSMVKVGFSQAVYQTSEDLNLPFGSSSNMLMNVVLSQAVDYDVTVNFTTQDGTAIGTTTGGEDYIAQSGSVTIPAGETTVPITMYIIHDQPIELDENFTVTLSSPNPSTSVGLGRSRATATILEQTTAPLCYQDNFNTTLDAKWRTLYSNGSFTPDINGGHLKLTPGKKNIATAVTKDYEFPSKQNLIVVEFKHYAYGGCFEENTPEAGLGDYGADGIVAVLYDSSVGASPTPGGYGGSMGYAQYVDNIPGFEGGWLGLGLDEYGNFANPTEGRVGGPGFHTNAAVIRGDGSGTSGYEFLAEAYGNPPITTPIAPIVDYTNPAKLPGDKYQMTVDARSNANLFITLKRDLDDGNGYQVVINKFDAKLPAYNQSTTPDFVRFALTSGTGGGCNAHEIDDLTVWGNCSVYTPTLGGAFRVTEDTSNASWTSKWPKKYLATKVAPLNKRYCVLAGTSANDSATPLTSAIGVDINVTDNNGYMKRLFTNLSIPAASSTTCFDANVTLAAKNMQFIITKSSDQSMKSFSDTFAVRPKTYVMDINGTTLFAGTTYKLDINATTTTSDGNISGYTTTVGAMTPNTSAQQIAAPSMLTCPAPTATPLSINFANGKATLNPFSYNDVMDINVTVVDGNWTETDQTNGGCILGSDSITSTPVGCLIKGIKQLKFVPHHFDLNLSVNNFNNGRFTYLSNPHVIVPKDFTMSGVLDLNITAKNALGGTTQGYNTLCYAKAKDINITYTPVVIPNLGTISVQALHDNVVINDINTTLGTNIVFPAMTKDIFTVDHNGSALLHFKMNFDRNQTRVVDPFKFNLTKIDVNTTGEVNATTVGDKSIDYVYGRVIPRDVRVFGAVPFSANAWYEVYRAADINGTSLAPSRNGAQWYVNTIHNDVVDGDANVTLVNTTATNKNSVSNATGIETYGFAAENPVYTAKAHINTDPWLWYGDNAQPYSDPSALNLDCLTHPCFKINVVPTMIRSGSAKTSNEGTKNSKTTGGGAGWHSTTDYAPAIR